MPQIYAVLFDGIVSGEYPPNTRLKEEALAQKFEVSRTPIRVTLRQLEQDGLVEIMPKRGARVVGFSVDDVEEVYDIRKSLEIQALKTSATYLNIQGLIEIRTKMKDIGQVTPSCTRKLTPGSTTTSSRPAVNDVLLPF